MFRTKLGAVCVALFAVVLAADPADAQGKKKKDKDTIPGSRWAYEVKQGGKVIDEGKFRAEDFKIYKLGNQIGTYSQIGKGEFKLDITKGKLKGEITMKLTKSKPHEVYNGEWEMAEGGKAKIRIEFLKD